MFGLRVTAQISQFAKEDGSKMAEMFDLDQVDIMSIAPITLFCFTLAAVSCITTSTIRTKQLRANDYSGSIVLSVGRFIAIQIATAVVAGIVAYALYWTPIWPLSMAVSCTGPAWGAVMAFGLYKSHRLPIVVSLPMLIGIGLLIGNQIAIVQRTIAAH